jgi:hypothetical protein
MNFKNFVIISFFFNFFYYICTPINNWRRGRAARLALQKLYSVPDDASKTFKKLGGFILIFRKIK